MSANVELADVFETILPESEILDRSSPEFPRHSTPWSVAYEKSPKLVLVPSTLERLQATVKKLCEMDVDFAVRGRGVGSSSASDVILSMRSFEEIGFDENSEAVLLGSGLDWGQVDEKLATLAPGYVVVGARCPYVGVTGSTLHGGLSWLSHEFGLGSDPANMLDAQIITADGRLLWASEEPDLLWALRGGGGNFGVVSALRLKAHRYAPVIFAGRIFFPVEAVPSVSKALAKWVREKPDPKLALHVLYLAAESLHGDASPVLMLIPFDARGEEHARGENGFKWVFDIPGAKSVVQEMALCDVHELQRASEASHGTAEGWLQGALLDEIDDETLIRGCQWFEKTKREHPDLGYGTFMLLEIMQKASFDSTAPGETAWPHGGKGQRHVLQLSVGGATDGKDTFESRKNRALRILKEAPTEISGKPHPPGAFIPNFSLEVHELEKIYEGNWDRLREIKRRYDPRGRFNKGMYIPPAEV